MREKIKLNVEPTNDANWTPTVRISLNLDSLQSLHSPTFIHIQCKYVMRHNKPDVGESKIFECKII
jgi:hypothetical protein